MSENLASALVAALAELAVVEKGRTATIPTKQGKEYSYEYADIADVVKLTRPALAKHGVVALTPVHGHGDELACTVILLHTSGDRLDLGPFPFPHGETAQATGSMVTYHRRYALVAALGMAAGDDDDGTTASPRPRQQRSQAPRSAAPSCPRCEKPLTGQPVKKVDGVFWHTSCLAEEGETTVSAVDASPASAADDPGRPFEGVDTP